MRTWCAEGQWRAAAGRPEPVRVLHVATGEEEVGAVPDVVLCPRPDCYRAAAALSAAAHAPLVWTGAGQPPGPVHAVCPPGAPLALRALALTPYKPL
jgi:hypothetical protein